MNICIMHWIMIILRSLVIKVEQAAQRESGRDSSK